MTVKLVWTPLARTDIKKIYIDIGKVNPQSAERYFQRIRSRIDSLARYPRAGERHPEIFPSARMLVEAPYVIFMRRCRMRKMRTFALWKSSV
ncbi:type II toxin-antitoxin system RelE/ParE family toxin [Agrobacterium rosae]|uniref:Type II toxin-antitoxin system RelE/ParE family toxin n=1 Tax=Agrobacterium rosae TaxID=1972867 RepID=A0AAW9FJM2_9HYPH|nr:type II toxin-antitoxin system RelE/ParE family toxin [Agrobacterium rosae]MDX8303371.1 type II toxin-antitoxin system RelE/ParE family toxin [Agrobacterium rosae]